MSRQPHPELFQRGPAAPVDLAAEAEQLQELASRVPSAVRLGTSSWAFPGWSGIVFDRDASPPVLAHHGLQAYARHPLLRCVGLDRGYYAPVPVADLQRLRDQTPSDFRFVLKADRRLVFPSGPGSDRDLFLNAAWASDQVVSPAAEILGPKLGTVLFQFPPVDPGALGGPRRFAESLYRFLTAVPTKVPVHVEIRTPALLNADYAAALRHSGGHHGYVVHPEMVSLPRQLAELPPRSGGPVLVRWMLQPGRSYREARDAWAPFRRLADPDPTRRGDVARAVRQSLEMGSEVLIVVNNKAEGSSPLSVIELARLLAADEVATL